MQTSDPVFRTLLNTNYQLRVPNFQRPYVWGTAQHERLWSAVVRQFQERKAVPYFMGAVVLAKAKESSRDVRPPRLIVDGQQRLITLQILLSVIYEYGTASLRKDIENALNWYVAPGVVRTPENYLKVYPGPHDRQDFLTCVNPEATDEEFVDPSGSIARAWDFYFDAVERFMLRKNRSATARELARTILDRFRFVMITTDGDANPQEIFETLNHDGVPLDQGDLVRNFLFMSVAPSTTDTLYEKSWRPFEDRLDRRQYESFLYAWTLLSPTARAWPSGSIARRNFFPAAKDALRRPTPKEMERVVVRLTHSGTSFADMVRLDFQPKNKQEQILTNVLEELQDFSAAPQPVVFHAFSRWKDDRRSHSISTGDLLRSLLAIESFTIRWMLSGKNQSALTPLFRSMVLAPTFDRDASRLSTAISRYLRERDQRPSDNDIRRHLGEKSFYGATGTGKQQFLVLRRLCYAMQYQSSSGDFLLRSHDPDAQIVDISKPKWTIDHIFPQKDAPWRKELGSRLERARDLRDNIGNLCPTPRNERMQNSPWKEKRQWYQGDDMLRMQSRIARSQRWNDATIRDRTRLLTNLALRVWPDKLV